MISLLFLTTLPGARAAVSDDMGSLLFTLLDGGKVCAEVAAIAEGAFRYDCALEGAENAYGGFRCINALDARCVYDDGDADDPDAGMTPGVTTIDCDTTVEELPEYDPVVFTEGETFITIETDEVPDHDVGTYPNSDNPYSITAMGSTFEVRIAPIGSGQDGGSWPLGVAVNGVTFDPSAALYWNDDRESGWEYEATSSALDLAMDCNYAHVNPSGAYHYHGFPEGLYDSAGGDGTDMVFFGYAADGIPIYGRYGYTDADDPDSGVSVLRSSYQLKSGDRPGDGTDEPDGEYDGTFVEDYEYVEGLGDLDECNGRTGETPDFGETYYYVITDTWPYIPRCVSYQPHSSFF
jgi:predicted heme/steroid binding protein